MHPTLLGAIWGQRLGRHLEAFALPFAQSFAREERVSLMKLVFTTRQNRSTNSNDALSGSDIAQFLPFPSVAGTSNDHDSVRDGNAETVQSTSRRTAQFFRQSATLATYFACGPTILVTEEFVSSP